MKVIVRGKNIELTEGIETKINKKLNMLDKYFIMSENVEAKVLIRTYPVGQKIEVTIPTEYVLLRAEVVDNDLYNAIDLVIDKLEGQIRKYKTRLSRKSKDNKLAFNVASIEPLEHEEEDVIVKTKSISPKPMDMEEAIMQMELIGHSFFVYRDVETYGTEKVSQDVILSAIKNEFDLTPQGIIDTLQLLRPIYQKTAVYGHFGRGDIDLPWEKLDRVDSLKKYL